MNSSRSRLILGTAQLGMAYGVANTTGQPGQEEAREIVRTAYLSGVTQFDTAPVYGESEAVLGDALSHADISDRVKVFTKFGRHGVASLGQARGELERSLDKLGLEKLAGVLLHSEDDLPQLKRIAKELSRAGLVDEIGVSVYSSESAVESLHADGVQVVQIPANVFDHRFRKAGVFDLAKRLGKGIQIRSAFLQGLIFMDSQAIPSKLREASSLLESFDAICKKYELNRLEAALGYLKVVYPESSVLFGAESVCQLNANCSAWDQTFSMDFVKSIRQAFESVDEHILDPRLW